MTFTAWGQRLATPRLWAEATTASASGCSDAVSTVAATATTSSQAPQSPFEASGCGQSLPRMAVTAGLPAVSVPVLSKATMFTLASRSSWAPPFTSTPIWASRVRALTTVTGMLMISAQGQAMISIASPRYSQPRVPSARSRKGWPKTSTGMATSSAARATTSGVYHRAKRSMKRSAGVRCARACSTICAMRVTVDRPAGRSTSTVRAPGPLTVPASTSSPTPGPRECSRR